MKCDFLSELGDEIRRKGGGGGGGSEMKVI